MRNTVLAAVCAAAAVLAGPAAAERADRTKPLNVEADQPGRIDLANQVVVFNGNVVVTKGTMVIRAARIEVRETPDGYHAAVATGSPGKPATFRQKRDGVDEVIEGSAQKLEYDGRADTIRFTGNAVVRRIRDGAVADELTGNVVSYDNTAEVFNVAGGAATPANPGGRVRIVLTPRGAASAPAPDPLPGLKQTPALGATKP